MELIKVNVETLKEYFKIKSNPELAKKLGVSRVAIWKWEKRGIPVSRQALIEVTTNGHIKANVAKEAS